MQDNDIKIFLECIQDLKAEMIDKIEKVDNKLSGVKAEIFTYLENDTHKHIDLIADGLQGLNTKVDAILAQQEEIK